MAGIRVEYPTGSGWEYSLDEVSWQTGRVFSKAAGGVDFIPGNTYIVHSRNLFQGVATQDFIVFGQHQNDNAGSLTLDQVARNGQPDDLGKTDQLIQLLGGLILGNLEAIGSAGAVSVLVIDQDGKVWKNAGSLPQVLNTRFTLNGGDAQDYERYVLQSFVGGYRLYIDGVLRMVYGHIGGGFAGLIDIQSGASIGISGNQIRLDATQVNAGSAEGYFRTTARSVLPTTAKSGQVLTPIYNQARGIFEDKFVSVATLMSDGFDTVVELLRKAGYRPAAETSSEPDAYEIIEVCDVSVPPPAKTEQDITITSANLGVALTNELRVDVSQIWPSALTPDFSPALDLINLAFTGPDTFTVTARYPADFEDPAYFISLHLRKKNP